LSSRLKIISDKDSKTNSRSELLSKQYGIEAYTFYKALRILGVEDREIKDAAKKYCIKGYFSITGHEFSECLDAFIKNYSTPTNEQS